MKKTNAGSSWLVTLYLTLIVDCVVLFFSIQRWVELKVILWRSIWAIPFLIFITVLLAGSYALFREYQGRSFFSLSFIQKLARFSNSQRISQPFFRSLSAVITIIIVISIPATKFWLHIGENIRGSTQDPTLTMIMFYWMVWWLLLIGGVFASLAFKTTWKRGISFFLVITGLCLELYSRYQSISNYPFSLGWSETSRYYYGSLFFSKLIYGQGFPLPILHPSRYLLQSLPFFFSGNNLEFSRFWQSFLWVVFAGITAIAMPKRIIKHNDRSQPDRFSSFLISSSIFLFLLRIGVYYHLQPMLFIPLFFSDVKHPRKTLFWLIIASVWAGLSRINWFAVPAMVLCVIYIFETPYQGKKNFWQYFATPISYLLIGLGTAFASQQAYIQFSGNSTNREAFTSSLSSDLLWNRLLPNDSFSLGILPGILLVTFPLIFHILLNLYVVRNGIKSIRLFTIGSIVLLFFVGGLIVSVKIGGGGDLHNMDAFSTFLVLVFLYSNFSQIKPDSNQKIHTSKFVWPVIFLGLLMPILFLLPSIKPIPNYDDKANDQALSKLKLLVESAAKDGDVLFINERHLVTFKQIDVPLVPDYEAVTLMEMAMSGNQDYLDTFYKKLQDHEFSAIVSGKLNTGIKTEGVFFEENNVWNSRVSNKILCYYTPAVIDTQPEETTMIEADESKITFLIPIEPTGDCK